MIAGSLGSIHATAPPPMMRSIFVAYPPTRVSKGVSVSTCCLNCFKVTWDAAQVFSMWLMRWLYCFESFSSCSTRALWAAIASSAVATLSIELSMCATRPPSSPIFAWMALICSNGCSCYSTDKKRPYKVGSVCFLDGLCVCSVGSPFLVYLVGEFIQLDVQLYFDVVYIV